MNTHCPRRLNRFLCVLVLIVPAGCASTYREMHPNGKLKKEGRLYFGMQEGDWSYFYDNGQIRARGHYTRDIPDGQWTYWYRNGQLEIEGRIEKERRTGEWTYWQTDGKPRARGRFDDGLETGEWSYYSRTGTLIRQGDFEGGRPALMVRFWHPNGEKKAEGYMFQGAKVGTWDYWAQNGAESARDYPAPAGCLLLREPWEGGSHRREGFVLNGQKTGRWITWHEEGPRRIEGDFTNGSPSGFWLAYDAAGKPLAAGRFAGGRLQGDWTFWTDGKPTVKRPDDFPKPEIATGEWSPASVAEAQAHEDVVRLWVGEAELPVDNDHFVDLVRKRDAPPPPAPPTSLEEETARDPGGLARAQPEFTVREQNEMEKYINYFTEGATEIYGGPTLGGDYMPAAASEKRERRGNSSISGPLLGMSMPDAILRTPDGGRIDLKDLRGKKVVLAILRGYAGQVCVYCATQVEAYSRDTAFEEFKRRGAEVIFVYPGPADHLEAFLEAYAASFGKKAPPYRMLYDKDLELAKQLGIIGNLAHPTTLILDAEGKIRFAYVAEGKADRPSVAKLTRELDRLGSGSIP
ncbi:MAG TPA: redoxin domain-containing protein [Planctomycetota bacterium]|nr:redoxin domain-containing protein [Planctomycetota bacterium]